MTMPRSARCSDDGARHPGTDIRIVDRLAAVGAEIVDLVSEPCQRRHEMLFQRKASMVGADRDPHDCGIIACGLGHHHEARRAARAQRSPVDLQVRRGRDRCRRRRSGRRRRPPRPAGRICALQRSIRDRPAHVLPRRGAARSVAVARAAAAGVRISHLPRARRHGLPAGARRSGPVARAGRRSLRRLPRAAGAGADDRSDAAGDHGAARRADRAGRHPGEERPAGPAPRGSRAARRGPVRHGARDDRGARRAGRLRRRSVSRTEDRAVPRPAREPDRGRAGTRTAACSMPSATTAGSR